MDELERSCMHESETMTGNVRPSTFPEFAVTILGKSRGELHAWAKVATEEVRTEDDGNEYVVKAYPKSIQTGRMVESAWTVPLLRK